MAEIGDETLEQLTEALERVSFLKNRYWMQMSEKVRTQRSEIELLQNVLEAGRRVVNEVRAPFDTPPDQGCLDALEAAILAYESLPKGGSPRE